MHLCTECSIGQFRVLVTGARRILCPGGALVYSVRHGGDTHAPAGDRCLDGCREYGGFVVRFFDRALLDEMASGYALETLEAFEEGDRPRRLWCVVMRAPGGEKT